MYKKYLMLLIVPILVISGCTSKSQKPISRTEFLMGTVCTIKVYDKSSDKVLDKAFNRIKEIENKMTINKAGSEVDSVNDASGQQTVKVSDDTFDVIKRGLYYSQLTEGKFDITIGPLVKLWGIGTDKARVPSQQEIDNTKVLTNYKDLVLDDSNKSVMLKNKNMMIDLGGIAKGYTADEMERILRENGVKHAIINLGGNIFAMDKNSHGNQWKVGVQDPFAERGNSIGIINVTNKSVVTSGIYERYFDQDGKHYHHILNPFTGYPYDNSLAGVTIISDKSIDGDGLSTSVFAMGLEQGQSFVKSLKGVDVIFVTKNKEVYITSGLKGNFKITDSDFTLKN